MLKGIDEQEIVTLVQIVARVRKASPDEDDLLTLMWEHEFAYIKYRYVDISFETASVIERSDDADRPRVIDSLAVREPPREFVAPPGVVNLDAFDSTLYFLDDAELQYLRTEIQQHYASDLRASVVTILLDVFEQQTDAAIRDEICGILDGLLVQLLSSGHLRTVAYTLREVNVSANRARELTPAQRELLLTLPNRISEPDAVAQLLQSLDERVEQPPQEELNELFEELRVGALGTVFAWIHRLQSPNVRKLLEAAAGRLAAANTNELVRLIGSSERDVSLEAVRRAGATKAAAAVQSLGRLLTNGDAEMRLASVQSLSEIGSAGALQQLERAIDDSERDVRVATAKALATRGYRAAMPKIEAVIKGKRVQEADLTEKMAFFEAYGTMCGEGGVSTLEAYLNGKGLFGKKEGPEVRACAALALGRIGTDAAFAALRKGATDKDVLVRNAVNKALRGVTSL
jgi:hypothetical protein